MHFCVLNVSDEARTKLTVAGATIVAYHSGDFDVISPVNGDELYKSLRFGRICPPERMKTTHLAVYDILKPLIEEPLKGFACIEGAQRYMKCNPVTSRYCTDLHGTKELTVIKQDTQTTSRYYFHYV